MTVTVDVMFYAETAALASLFLWCLSYRLVINAVASIGSRTFGSAENGVICQLLRLWHTDTLNNIALITL